MLAVAAIVFPPVALLVLAALVAIGASGPYLIFRHGKRNKGISLLSLATASFLALLCPEYNDSALTFAGGLLLIFPLVFLILHFLKGVVRP